MGYVLISYKEAGRGADLLQSALFVPPAAVGVVCRPGAAPWLPRGALGNMFCNGMEELHPSTSLLLPPQLFFNIAYLYMEFAVTLVLCFTPLASITTAAFYLLA